MPIDPQDPNNPNNPIQPNIPPVDLSKLIDTEAARANIEKFFHEMLSKIEPGVKDALKDVKKDVKDVWEDITVNGIRTLRKITDAGTGAVKDFAKESQAELEKLKKTDLSSIGMTGRVGVDALSTGVSGLMNVLTTGASGFNEELTHSVEISKQLQKTGVMVPTPPKIILTPAEQAKEAEYDDTRTDAEKKAIKDLKDAELAARAENANRQVALDKKHFNDVQKYLKINKGAEKAAISEIHAERDRLLDVAEKEYQIQLAAANARRASGEAALKIEQDIVKLGQQRDKDKAGIRKDSAEKERGVRKESPWDLSKLTGGGIAKRAEADMAGMLVKTLEKFSSLAFVVGGVAAIFMKLLAAGQEYLINENALVAMSKDALGLAGDKEAGRRLDVSMEASPLYQGAAYDQEARVETAGIIANSPALLKQTSTKEGFQKLEGFQSILANFKVDLKDSAKIATNATNELGLSLDDLSKMALVAGARNKDFGTSVMETFQQMTHLSSILRTVSYGTKDATTIMSVFNKTMMASGKAGGRQPEKGDIKRIQEQFSGALSSMSTGQFAGIFGITHSDKNDQPRMPTVEDYRNQRDGNKGSGLAADAMKAIISKMGTTLDENGAGVIETLQGTTNALMGYLPSKSDSVTLLDTLRNMKTAMSKGQDITKIVKDFSEPKLTPAEQAQKDGVKAMEGSTSVMAKLTTALSDLYKAIALGGGLTEGVNMLNDTFKLVRGTQNLFKKETDAIKTIWDWSNETSPNDKVAQYNANLPKGAARMKDE